LKASEKFSLDEARESIPFGRSLRFPNAETLISWKHPPQRPNQTLNFAKNARAAENL
jgi:hypothetical protein